MAATRYTYTTAAGQTYYLHGEPGARPGASARPPYWFARRPWPGAALAAVPPGYQVVESLLTHRPYLRRGVHRDGPAVRKPPAR